MQIYSYKTRDCSVPNTIFRNVFIDFYNYGFDVGISQLMSVLKGENAFVPAQKEFKNVVEKITICSNNRLDIEIKATYFQEPTARFLILFKNKPSNVKVSNNSESFFNGGLQNDLRLNNGTICNGFFIGLSRALTPNFSLRVSIETNEKKVLVCLE